MMQTSAVQPSSVRPGDLTRTPIHNDPDAPLLPRTGSPQRALIVGDHGVGLMCALLKRGCATAATIRAGAKPEAHDYDLLLLPDGAAFTSADDIVRLARTCLAREGRLAARMPDRSTAASLVRRLRLNGFSVAARQERDRTVRAVLRRAVA